MYPRVSKSLLKKKKNTIFAKEGDNISEQINAAVVACLNPIGKIILKKQVKLCISGYAPRYN